MTKLSIFLWAADSLDKIANVFLSIGIICTILSIIIIICVVVCCWCSYEDTQIEHTVCKHPIGIMAVIITLTLGSFFLFSLIPSKKTMYMIAGVELTNSIMQSDDYQKVKKYLGDSGVQILDDIKSVIHIEVSKVKNSTTEK